MTADVEAYLQELRSWVEIETPTADSEAVNRLGAIIARSAEQAGLAVERLPGAPGLGDLILARGGRQTEAPGLLVLAHMDTVHPKGTLERDLPWRLDGDRQYGPGIYDMKGSALLALQAWRDISAAGRAPNHPVTFLFSPDEEVGSPGSRPIIEAEARRAFATFVVEPARDGGKIVVGRKGIARFTITAQGVPAHSGSNFEQGRSAIREMARQLLDLEALTDLEQGLTVSVNTIAGGSSPNTIAGNCAITVDVRLKRPDQGDLILSRIRSIKPYDPDVTIKVEGGLNRPPFFPDIPANRLFDHARRLAARSGIDLVGVEAGGASDGNFAAASGTPTLDGLGVDGAGAHTLDEYILISSIAPRIQLFGDLLAETTAGDVEV
ncbi:MAG TPA: M20 family metallopeptidase [Devosiaceae bacterium]|jgi:glutamate carboxypeptidase|nr:M20 family metallopeptidase [Devosiaceae bacterium]